MSTESERRNLLEQALREGQLALERGELENARQQFRSALRIEAGNEIALAGLQAADKKESAAADAADFRATMAAGKTARDSRNWPQAVGEYQKARDIAARMSAKEKRDANVEYYLARGEQSLEADDYVSAMEFFRKARDLDDERPEARAGLVATFLRRGDQAEQRRQLGNAAAIYEELLRFDPGNNEGKARLRSVQFRIWRTRALIAAGLAVILLVAMAQANRMISWPVGACDVSTIGEVLCTPTATPTATFTPTSTYTPTATPTNTPTATATATATTTATATDTPTATPTYTPTPMVAQPRFNQTGVYPEPYSTRLVAVLWQDDVIYLCAKAANRYLVAKNYCHLTDPLGWVNIDNIAPSFATSFPESLTTPLPPPTDTPRPTPTVTPTAVPEPTATPGGGAG